MLLCQHVSHKVAEMMLWCEEREKDLGKMVFIYNCYTINFTILKGDQSKLDLIVSTSGAPSKKMLY